MAAGWVNVIVNYVSNEVAAFSLVQEIEASKGGAAAIKADASTEDEVLSMFVDA